MNRRADRIIAASAIAAVAVVPTVLLVVVNSSRAEPEGAGQLPAAAAAANRTATPSASPTPGAALPYSGGKPRGTAGPVTGGGTTRRPVAAPGTTAPVGYTRKTEGRLSGAANGDSEQGTETATIVLSPVFAFDASGVTTSVRNGEQTSRTGRVVIKGTKMSTNDGGAWTHTDLGAQQATTLAQNSDPRLYTSLARGLPGVKKTAGAGGSSRYQGSAKLDDVMWLLPSDWADQARQVFPAGTTAGVDVRADRTGRPTWLGISAHAPGADFTLGMTFSGYR